MDDQGSNKTTTELEAEARERAKAEIAGQKTTAAEAPPGQPKVVIHNKPKSKRTLIVSVISLLALAGVAIGGDYLMNMAKGDKSEQKEEAKAPKTNSMTPSKERKGMGRDANPFEGQAKPSDSGHAEQQQQEAAAPQPVTFNKTSALSLSVGNAGNSQQNYLHSNTQGTVTENHTDAASDARLAQCKKVLVRSPDGKLSCPDSEATTDETGDGNGIARVTAVKRLNLDPNLYIPVGRHIPCSLTKRFVSDVAGKLTCQISEDVYSANNFVKLIPAGTTARLIYRTGTLKNGMGRMFIGATELRTPEPNALVIPMMDSQAVGQLGENGVDGWIDEHWMERIGNTLLLGTVQDFAAAAADSAPGKDRNTDYTENTRTATAEMAKTVLNNSINIPPTMYKNHGDIIALETGADIDFSGVYKLHKR
ncbi:TrbI/VirB10 family protein [Salmonella enterica]|nr:TrbI/VirB10 family protein [Salmonella enterica]